MNEIPWSSVFKLITGFLTSLGGGAAIIWAVCSWVGKIWANKILESDRLKYQSELEKIKKEY